jgi:hypothetical protein
MSIKCIAALCFSIALKPVATQAAEPHPLIPSHLPKQYQVNLQKFLDRQAKPTTIFIPLTSEIMRLNSTDAPLKLDLQVSRPFKQYVTQITMHRPVPGKPPPDRADVYYYRIPPDAGKPGITLRYTVDLSRGVEVTPPVLLPNYPTPLAREEIDEAVRLAREKSDPVRALFQRAEDQKSVSWEYLTPYIGRKSNGHEPGDRVVSLRFRSAPKGQARPESVLVWVNLTRRAVSYPDQRR